MKLVLQIALGIVLAPIVAIVLIVALAGSLAALGSNADMILILGVIGLGLLTWIKWVQPFISRRWAARSAASN